MPDRRRVPAKIASHAHVVRGLAGGGIADRAFVACRSPLYTVKNVFSRQREFGRTKVDALKNKIDSKAVVQNCNQYH
jgi:hypothetical protein